MVGLQHSVKAWWSDRRFLFCFSLDVLGCAILICSLWTYIKLVYGNVFCHNTSFTTCRTTLAYRFYTIQSPLLYMPNYFSLIKRLILSASKKLDKNGLTRQNQWLGDTLILTTLRHIMCLKWCQTRFSKINTDFPIMNPPCMRTFDYRDVCRQNLFRNSVDEVSAISSWETVSNVGRWK